MTQVYAHLKPDGLKQAMERTFGGGTSATPDVQAELESLRAELAQKNAILEQLRVSLS